MRTLRFKANGQKLTQDPNCNFNCIVPGSKGYLKVAVEFDSEWSGYEKIAIFTKQTTSERIGVRLENNVCDIPDFITEKRKFKIEIVGVKPGSRINTNRLEVKQDG